MLPKIKTTIFNQSAKEHYVVIAHNEDDSFWARHAQSRRLVVIKADPIANEGDEVRYFEVKR